MPTWESLGDRAVEIPNIVCVRKYPQVSIMHLLLVDVGVTVVDQVFITYKYSESSDII